MEKFDFNERLSWADIVKKYPHKWVGLSAIDWSGGKILSAVVKYVDDSIDKIFDRQITVGDVEAEYTTPDELMSNFNSGFTFLPTKNNYSDKTEGITR